MRRWQIVWWSVLIGGCSSAAKSPRAENADRAEAGLPSDAGTADGALSSGGDSGLTEGLATDARACPETQDAENAGNIEDVSLSEVSGMVSGRVNPDVLWLHNDSGDTARLFATTTDGKARATVELTGADAVDWEDIAIGPGPVRGRSYLYVADIGDNEKRRESVQIYRVAEPTLPAPGAAANLSMAAERIDVAYEDGPHDAETLLVDPVTGALYIVEKSFPNSGVYRVADASGDGRMTATRVASINLILSTGGDVLPDGAGLTIRTYAGVSYWPRDPALPLESAFTNEPCSLKLAAETQGEAVGFFANGAGYYTVSEGVGEMLHAYRFESGISSRSQ